MAHNPIKSAGDEKREALLVVEKKTRTARPPMYKVMLLNDDYTPMDFVVYLLKQIFRKAHGDAIRVMLEIHNRGSGTGGIYTRDVAETKMEQVVHAARQNEHPLQCVIEKEG